MRPEKLEFCGVKSYTDKTVVEFDKLLKSGLFGIFGNTGSGKSTILDCIFLALYGRLPKTSEREDYINLKSGKCYVRFLFSLFKDGTRKYYEVYREFQLKGTRKTQPNPIAKLYEIVGDDKYSLEDNTSKVNQKLLDIIGLDIDDFEKCIVLPQGEFSAFVRLQRASRLSMISGLFNLDKYGDKLTQKLKDIQVGLDNDINYTKGNLRPYEEATKEALCELEKMLKNQRVSYRSQNEIVLKIEEELKDFEKNYERRNIYLDSLKALEELEKNKERIDWIKRVESKFDEAKNLIENTDELNSLTRDISVLSKEKDDLVVKEKALISNLSRVESDLLNEPVLNAEVSKITSDLGVLNLLSEDEKDKVDLEKQLITLRNNYKEKQNEITWRSNKVSNLEKEFLKLKTADEFSDLEIKINLKIDELIKSSQAEFLSDEISFLKDLTKCVDDSSIIEERIAYLKNLLSSDAVLPNVVKDLNTLYIKLDEYNKICDDYNGKISAENVQIEKDKQIRDGFSEQGKTIRETVDKINARIRSLTNGEVLDDKINALNKRKGEIENLLSRLKDEKNGISNKLSEIKEALLGVSAQLSHKIENRQAILVSVNESLKHFDSYEDAEKIYSCKDDLDKLKKEVGEYEYSKRSLKDKLSFVPDGAFLTAYTDENLQNLKKNLDVEQKKREELIINYNNLLEKHKNLSQNFEKRCIIEKDLLSLETERKTVNSLFEAVKNKKLLGFIAEEYLSEIALDAKSILLELTGGRYGLVYSEDFFVEDFFYGENSLRRADAVSGGELFLVSLSLALALSKCIYAKSSAPMEFFFLDEGFGSLDKELLEVVLDCLFKLKNSNFSIGVISHVESLKERLPARITVNSAKGDKGSTITVIA